MSVVDSKMFGGKVLIAPDVVAVFFYNSSVWKVHYADAPQHVGVDTGRPRFISTHPN